MPDGRRPGSRAAKGRRQLLAFLGWFAFGFVLLLLLLTVVPGEEGPGSEATAAFRGSALPCQVPIPWRVGEIDPRFDVTQSEVISAAHRAASLWQTVTAGQRLFRRDDGEGIPIHLAFDRRQADVRERTRERGVLDSLGAAARARRSEIQTLADRLQSERRRLDRRQRDLNRRVSRFNERAERLRGGRGVSASEVRDLRRIRAQLESEQAALERDVGELERLASRLEAAEAEFRRLRREYERRGEEAGGGSSPERVIAGTYDEEVTVEDGRPVAVEDRTITVFRFADREALARILAHEFGHALGLGHASDTASVMAETAVDDAGRGGLLSVNEADVALLRERCPDLAPGG